MADDKKPRLKDLIKNIPVRPNTSGVSRIPPKPPPPPQKVAQPAVEKPAMIDRDSLPSQEVDLTELEEEKPIIRIPNKEIEVNTRDLLKLMLKTDKSLWGIFKDKHLGMDENQNILIGERIIGKFMDDSARIYFHKLWQGNVHGKLELFTKNNVFIMTSKSKCIFFVIEEKNLYLAYSDKEGGKEAPMKMVI